MRPKLIIEKNIPPRIEPTELREGLKGLLWEDRFRPDFDGWGTPKKGTTHCNQFVAEVLGWYDPSYPWGKFATPKMGATKMVEEMGKNNPPWCNCSNWDTATAHATRGHLVVAGGDGHVCILAPEKMEYSGSWMKMVPLCANVGKTVFYGRRLSWAFRTEPEAWLFRGNKEEV